jgi:flagellar P-ring protein precursor FlgI
MRAAPLAFAVGLAAATLSGPAVAQADVRVKDVARIHGVRENSLVGYGLVAGLNGTGDKGRSSPFTPQAVANMLQRLGVALPPGTIDGKNVAAVMVTAKLPPFARPGSAVDVTVSSLGDATTLQGGTLLLTPLQGPDGRVYAAAQGPLSIGGFSFGGASGDTVQQNHPTVGRVPNGALIEREVPMSLEAGTLSLRLVQPDFTTAVRLAAAVNGVAPGAARAVDPATVVVAVPHADPHRAMEFIAQVESARLEVDAPARIVISERTGTVIIGNEVRIATVAISHGNLSIQVREEYQVSQPAPFADRGRTVVVPQSDVTVKEEKSKLMVVREGASIGDVVRALNALGVSPRDLIAILQAMKRSGALLADLEIM